MAGKRLAGVKFDGLDSFLEELRVLTAELVDEAGEILTDSAETAALAIVTAYPYKSGNLRRGIEVRPSRGIALAGAELVQNAPHGYIYDKGTKARTNKAGQNRGRMAPTPTFEPIAAAHRARAIAAVIDRVHEHGASRVTGDADAA